MDKLLSLGNIFFLKLHLKNLALHYYPIRLGARAWGNMWLPNCKGLSLYLVYIVVVQTAFWYIKSKKQRFRESFGLVVKYQITFSVFGYFALKKRFLVYHWTSFFLHAGFLSVLNVLK